MQLRRQRFYNYVIGIFYAANLAILVWACMLLNVFLNFPFIIKVKQLKMMLRLNVCRPSTWLLLQCIYICIKPRSELIPQQTIHKSTNVNSKLLSNFDEVMYGKAGTLSNITDNLQGSTKQFTSSTERNSDNVTNVV